MIAYNLNIARAYAPNWAVVQALREIGANYLDAGDHETEETPDGLRFVSNANPGLDALFVMGATDKREDGRSIGTFGEGLKMAALVLTRETGCALVIRSPKGRIAFEFRKPDGFGIEVLHAVLDETDVSDKFVTEVTGATRAVHDRLFLARRPKGSCKMRKYDVGEPTKIFCKGVFVMAIADMKSAYHWNLDNLTLNRDRSIAEESAIRNCIREIVLAGLDETSARELLEYPERVESYSVTMNTWIPEPCRPPVIAAFRSVYGKKALLASPSAYKNAIAFRKGYTPTEIEHYDLRLTLRCLHGIGQVDEIVADQDGMKRTRVTAEVKREARMLLDLLGIDAPVEIRMFEPDETHDGEGYCDNRGSKPVVWINKMLTEPGRKRGRLAALCHELAHAVSGANDETYKFEHCLTEMLGKLADRLI